MLRYPVKFAFICAGLCGIVLGAHGIYIHYSALEILARAFASTLDSTRLFLIIGVPSWFKGTVQWASEKGAASWQIPVLLILGGIIIIAYALAINTRSQLLSSRGRYMSEPTWQRAWKDTEGFRRTTKFFWAVEIVGVAAFGVLGGMGGVWLTPTHATTFQQYLYPAVGTAAGLVLGFTLVFGLIYVWNLFRAPFRQRNDALRLAGDMQQQYAAIFDSVRFGLAFDNVTMDTGKSSEGVPFLIIGIKLQNTSKELIQHRLLKFEVILGGKTVGNPTFSNTSVYAFPGKTSQYYYPAIDGVDITKPILGTLEYEIIYSSVPDIHWVMSNRKLAIELLITDLATVQGRTRWHVLEEESPIKEIPDERG